MNAAVDTPTSTPSIVKWSPTVKRTRRSRLRSRPRREPAFEDTELGTKMTSITEPLLTNNQIDAVVQCYDYLIEQFQVDSLVDAITL
ncbi:hypothetical protein [Halalkalicoccus salilacus]